MILTKTYRIWWNKKDKIILNDYKRSYEGSITYCGNNNYAYYESDNYQDILEKIKSEKLIKNNELI